MMKLFYVLLSFVATTIDIVDLFILGELSSATLSIISYKVQCNHMVNSY